MRNRKTPTTSSTPGNTAASASTPTAKRSWTRMIVIAAVVYIGALAVFAASPPLQQCLVYLHHLSNPFLPASFEPREYGQQFARNIHTRSGDDGPLLNGWHIPPSSDTTTTQAFLALYADTQLDETTRNTRIDALMDAALASDQQRVVIYMHGNAFSRTQTHRVQLYGLLANRLNAHVIVFDYRGFGDSDGWPTEAGVASDAHAMWEWTLARVKKASHIRLWGHSLGTAVAGRLAAELCRAGTPPAGLVLEAPLTSMPEAALHHPSGLFFRFLIPGADSVIQMVLHDKWDTKEHMPHISCPLLILHGDQDAILPVQMGHTLHSLARPHAQLVIAPHGSHNDLTAQLHMLPHIFAFFDATDV